MGPGAVTTSAVAGTEAALALAANEVFGYISTAHEELCDAGRRAKARVCMHACMQAHVLVSLQRTGA